MSAVDEWASSTTVYTYEDLFPVSTNLSDDFFYRSQSPFVRSPYDNDEFNVKATETSAHNAFTQNANLISHPQLNDAPAIVVASTSATLPALVVVSGVKAKPSIATDDDGIAADDDEAKKQKHRQIDAVRRHKEQAVMSRLQSVCGITPPAEIPRSKRKSRSKTSASAKVDRIGTLSAAVNKIEDLLAEIERLKRPSSDSNFDGYIDTVEVYKRQRKESAVRRIITHKQINESFLAALTYNSALVQVVTQEETGICVFVNEAFTAACRMTYDEVVNTELCWPKKTVMTMFDNDADNPIHEERISLIAPPQYPSALHAYARLMSGKTNNASALIRTLDGQGNLQEIHVTIGIFEVGGIRHIHHISPTYRVTDLATALEPLHAQYLDMIAIN